MKNFQRNLFILLALCLCGTCVYQWNQQATQLNRIVQLNQVIYKNSSDIQRFTNSIQTMDVEINQLHDRLGQLKQTVASNEQWAIGEKREVARLQADGDSLTNEITQYKAVVQDLTNKLHEAFQGEKELAAQRDEFIKKLTNSINSQNQLVVKYNELVERFNKLQSNQAAPATPPGQ